MKASLEETKWKKIDYADLKLFSDGIKNWTVNLVNDTQLLEDTKVPFILRAMFPNIARKMSAKCTIAGEINVVLIPIDSFEKVLTIKYLEVWQSGRIPILFYRSSGPSLGSISQSFLPKLQEYGTQIRQYKIALSKGVSPTSEITPVLAEWFNEFKDTNTSFEFEEYYIKPISFEDWLASVIEKMNPEHIEKFKPIIQESFVGFAHHANKSIQDIQDPRERYMRLLDAICCIAKFGPVNECMDFAKQCYMLDVLEQDKSDPQPWMEDDVRMNCLKRLDNDRIVFSKVLKQAMMSMKLDSLKATLLHFASLLYHFNKYQLPLVETEEEAVRRQLESEDPFKQMVNNIQAEIDDP